MLGLGRLRRVGCSGSTQWNNPTNLTDPTGFLTDDNNVNSNKGQGQEPKTPDPKEPKIIPSNCIVGLPCLVTLTDGSKMVIIILPSGSEQGASGTKETKNITPKKADTTNNGGETKSVWQKTKGLFGQAMRSFGVFDMFVPSRASFESGASQLLGGPCDYNCEGHNASVKLTADVFEGAAQGVAEAGNRYYPELAKNVLLSALPEMALAKGEVIVYRVFGGDARAEGFSWTTLDPRTISNFRDAAGLPSGGVSGATNTAEFLIKGSVNVKEIIKSRSALPLDGNKGGLPELIIDPKKVKMIEFKVIKP